ncbi:MAG: hypothetical protein WHV26_10265 [Spirochaetota bacterium]
MNKLFVVVFIITLFIGSTGFTADLVNKDSRSYSIEVSSVGTLHTSISSNTTMINGAPNGSTIKIKETGSTITVDGDNPVIIQDGKLSQ